MCVSTTRFYIMCRVYSKYLGPSTISQLAKDLELSEGIIGKTINRLIEEGYLTWVSKTAEKPRHLVMTDAGCTYYLLLFGGVIIPPPEHLRFCHDEHYRTMRKIDGRSSYGWVVRNLKILLARAAPASLEPILARFGIKPIEWGNQNFRTREMPAEGDLAPPPPPSDTHKRKLEKRKANLKKRYQFKTIKKS